MPNPLTDVEHWLYLIGGTSDRRVDRIAQMPIDLVVVDSEDENGIAVTTDKVDLMQGANDKLVISYLSIGEAEDYRDYWDPEWETTPPDFLATVNSQWAGNYKVRYWDPEWQAIILDWVDDIVAAGFNGLYLDIIDAYAYWERKEPGEMDYRTLMIEFVEAIRAKAENKLEDLGDTTRPFAIIGQNGEDLADNPDYLAAVDGMGKEDLFFYYPNGKANTFGPVPKGWLTGSKELLETATDAGVKVLVVEYVPPKFLNDVVGRLRDEIAYLDERLDSPFYLSSNRKLTTFDVVIDRDGQVRIWGSDENDALRGTKFDDRIEGFDGNDTIRSGRGADTIDAGAGDDTIRGGRGADRFVFEPNDETLRIKDFGQGRDVVDLTALGIEDFVSLMLLANRTGRHVTFDFGDRDTVILEYTRIRQLDTTDFDL